MEFFGETLARELAREGRRADLIIGNNVLAHVPQLNDFVAGIALLLEPEGTATIEFPHLLKLIEHVEFDTIYHEHYSYISLLRHRTGVRPRHGLRIYDVEELPTHGGSLRIFASHAGRAGLADSAALRTLRAQEAAAGLADLETYLRFAERVEGCRRSLLDFLAQAKREGKVVAAYGAAAKGNTLLNFCGVTREDISMVADRNPHKQSKLLPGTHIPVVSPERVDASGAGLRAGAAVEFAGRDPASARRHQGLGRPVRHPGTRRAHSSMIFTEIDACRARTRSI